MATQRTTAELLAQRIAAIYQNTNNEIDAGNHADLLDDLIASIPTFLSYGTYFGLFPYEASRSYTVGQAVVYSGEIYICTTNTTGTWNASHWTQKSGSSAALRTGRVTLLAGSNTVAFENGSAVAYPMPTNNYNVIPYEVSGVGVSEPYNLTVDGFDIDAISGCDLIYFAIQNV